MEEQSNGHQLPFVDFSLQFGLAKNSEKVEKCIFESLKEIAKSIADGSASKLGALIVVGDFEKHGPVIQGMVQMKPKQNPVEKLMLFDGEQGAGFINELSGSGFDGAMVVDRTGQILGAGIYLVVDDPTLDTPEDCGTRHKAAASFSRRPDVISVLTLSEETNTVRVWQHGKVKEVFRVLGHEEEEKKQKRKNSKATVKENEE